MSPNTLTVVCYVATDSITEAGQSINNILRFCKRELGIDSADPGHSLTLRKKLAKPEYNIATLDGDRHTIRFYADIGNEQSKFGLKRLMQEADDADMNHIVVSNPQDLFPAEDSELDDLQFIRLLVDKYGMDLSIANPPIVTVHATPSRSVIRALALPESTTKAPGPLTRYRGGRPPLGFTSENGHLVPAENFERVRQVLMRVQDGMSKSRAAELLECTRQTIRAAVNRPNLYQLPQ